MSAVETNEILSAVSSPLPWHLEQWQHLMSLSHKQQLPHALLVSGAAYTGKSNFVMALARGLLCEAPTDESNCGQCHPCQLSAAGSHGDFLWVQPQEKSKVIKVDQMRYAVSFTQATAGFGRNKILVFSPANNMNVNAYNALLKSLEEPSPNTYLILVCDSLYGIPATIRSRCYHLHLGSPDLQEADRWLQLTTNDESLSQQALALTNGSPILAQTLYLNQTLEEYAQKRLAMRRLFTGEMSVIEIGQVLSDQEPEEFLQLYLAELRRAARGLPAEDLSGVRGRVVFALIDQAQSLYRAVKAGSNPGRALVVDLFLSKSHRVLGTS